MGERDDVEEELLRAPSQKLGGRGWAVPGIAESPHENFLPLDSSWRSLLRAAYQVAPLQLLLDPGLSLVSRCTPTLDSLGSELPGLSDPTLPSLRQLEVIKLLEQPELPVHRFSRSAQKTRVAQDWQAVPSRQRKRHDPAPLPALTDLPGDALPLPRPRPYVFGQADENTVDVSLDALAGRGVVVPDIGASSHLRFQVNVGQGEGAFLNARSALWSWRPHRQPGVQVHTHGPPVIGRDLLLEQRVGLVTVLQGCRVMTLTEEDRCWGFTLGSLDGQVYRLWERLLVEWQDDGQVSLFISSHHELGLRGLGLVAPLLNSARRNAVQGYARGMTELAEL